MTLSDKRVLDALRSKFVCGWKNIKGTAQAGVSHEHAASNKPAVVNNGSGFHNVQIFLMTPDARVVHCLPGFWKADVLAKEIEFALTLVKIWQDGSLTLRKRAERFAQAHLEHMGLHSSKEIRESELPGFDQWHERDKKGGDTVRASGDVKKADQIVHERMAERAFVPFEKFDVGKYADVGQRFYDADCDGCRASR